MKALFVKSFIRQMTSIVTLLQTVTTKTNRPLPRLLQDQVTRKITYLFGHFTFWISLQLRPKTETKRLNFGLSRELRLVNQLP